MLYLLLLVKKRQCPSQRDQCSHPRVSFFSLSDCNFFAVQERILGCSTLQEGLCGFPQMVSSRSSSPAIAGCDKKFKGLTACLETSDEATLQEWVDIVQKYIDRRRALGFRRKMDPATRKSLRRRSPLLVPTRKMERQPRAFVPITESDFASSSSQYDSDNDEIAEFGFPFP